MGEVSRERWAELYRYSFPKVYRALVATLLNAELAREALHHAFLVGLERPLEDRNPEGWLYRVALRHARRPSLRHFPLLREVRADGPEREVLDRIEVGQLLLLLTQRQRSIVVAHYYLGFTQNEIAEMLEVSRGTVGATISAALTRMRRGAAHA
jgi:RNA polymerase sigma factor (sigma-70 family)